MATRILTPQDLTAELVARTSGLGVELVPYDGHGQPSTDSTGAVGLFRWWISTEEGDALIRLHPSMRWIHTGSAGVDHILTPTFRQSSITLTNSAGVHSPSIAEWVVAMILAEDKNISKIYSQQRDRIWRTVRSSEVSGRTAVIIGGGEIARAISTRLRGLGIRVAALTRTGRPDEAFDEVRLVRELPSAAAACDWLIVAAPLTNETRKLVGKDVIAALGSGCRLVNVARGQIVDEAALIQALEEGTIAGAILDVFETEPLPPEHPFWAMESVRVLPHTTWRSEQVHDRQLSLFVENLQRFLRGEALRNVVDPTRGY